MKATHMYKFFGFSILVLLLVACECLEPDPPINEENFPEPSFQVDSFQFSLDGTQVIIIFNKPVDPGSIIPYESLIVSGGSALYSGVFELSDDHLILSIPECQIRCPFEVCEERSTLTLVGTPSDGTVVRSMEGEVLDGDQDGSAGGDFEASFLLGTSCFKSATWVTEPKEGQNDENGLLFNNDGSFYFDVVFSPNSIDTATLIQGENFLLYTLPFGNENEATLIPGTIKWEPYNFRFRFTSDTKNYITDCGESQCSTKLILKGTGSNPIRDIFRSPLYEDGYSSARDFEAYLYIYW